MRAPVSSFHLRHELRQTRRSPTVAVDTAITQHMEDSRNLNSAVIENFFGTYILLSGSLSETASGCPSWHSARQAGPSQHSFCSSHSSCAASVLELRKTKKRQGRSLRTCREDLLLEWTPWLQNRCWRSRVARRRVSPEKTKRGIELRCTQARENILQRTPP